METVEFEKLKSGSKKDQHARSQRESRQRFLKKRKIQRKRKKTFEFYNSIEWRKLRYDFLKSKNGSCMACGRNHKNHGVVVSVDHIKPRSKYPDLALSKDNLQLLCEDCNKGKSNRDETDWRAK